MTNQVVALNDEQIRAVAPAVFAEQPSSKVSDRYEFIPTIQLVNALRDEGWYPVKAGQSRAHTELGRNFAQHSLRFRHPSNDDVQVVGDVVPEIVLYNSHNAGSSFRFDAGLYRLVCSNGLVVADCTLGGGRVRHVGEEAIGEVIEGVFSVIEDTPRVLEDVARLQGIEINREERVLLATAAAHLRWEEGKEPVEPVSLIKRRRYGDDKPDLWTQFNVIQENIIKGGVRGYRTDARGEFRRSSVRAITAPDKNIGLNKALWELAVGFADLKEGKAELVVNGEAA